MYINKLSDFDIDDSISDVYPHHHQTFDPQVTNVVEFRTDDNQWTYWVVQVDGFNYILQ